MTLEGGPQFESVIEYLRETRGADFTGYKRPSLLRRVSRRCQELGIDSFTSYLDHLQVHAEEFQVLFDKILINVTEFLRDRPAWDYLAANVLPRTIARGGPIRVWSTGTASGEEAYSAAILLCEAMGQDEFVRRVKIYATDIDEDALNKARAGYTAKHLESLDEDLRARYFEAQGARFGFRVALRRALIFGRHDLMQDAPISRLDLLICRNCLMYFTAEAQERILGRFHYALKDDGALFLGKAEMLLSHADLFQPVDLKQRIFSKVAPLRLRERRLLPTELGDVETIQARQGYTSAFRRWHVQNIDASGVEGRGRRADRCRLHQRARHVDDNERPKRERRDSRGIRRLREFRFGELDQKLDGTLDRRRGCRRSRRVRARDSTW